MDNVTNLEFGAYLIALGTSMITNDVKANQANDDFDEAKIEHMSRNGIDAARAEEILESCWAACRSLNSPTA